MKKIALYSCLALMVSCSEKEKKESTTESKNFQVVCDSIIESSFDAQGNEMFLHKWHCDTIFEPNSSK